MSVILGVDAAWTVKEPSGVALIARQATGWRCLAIAPSYAEFVRQAEGGQTDWQAVKPRGELPDPERLLKSAERLAGAPVELVAIDMPVARKTFVGRRAADNAVSLEFASRWCAAHTPTKRRPGPLGVRLTAAFDKLGYPVMTGETPAREPRSMIEVYPHPALLSLLGKKRRVPYKVGKAKKYWPDLSVAERIERLHAQYTDVLTALSRAIALPDPWLPPASEIGTLAGLKRYEDALDALICTWVGVQYREGRTVALGDEDAAIWCPADVVHRAVAS